MKIKCFTFICIQFRKHLLLPKPQQKGNLLMSPIKTAYSEKLDIR